MPLQATPAVCRPKSRSNPTPSTLFPPAQSLARQDGPSGDCASTAIPEPERTPAAVAAASVTSLDPYESNAQIWDCPVHSYRRHRHRDNWEQRKRLHQALAKTGTSKKALDRFAKCGGNAVVLQHKHHPDRIKIGCEKCRHRLCHACQREIGGVIRSNLSALAGSAKSQLSMLTLTLKHTQARLRPTLKRLLTAFRDLRRLTTWKKHVHAAAWVLEIKIGNDGLWHPHIHCLMHATYIDQAWLSQAWLAATGDSNIVHIERINFADGSRYISKYVTKPIDNSVWRSEDALQEFITATRGLRRCATLGKWRGCKLSQPAEDPDVYDTTDSNCPKNWQVLCTVQDLIIEMRRGDELAQRIFLDLLKARKDPDP